MASFDPSIISQIPDFAPNPIEARAKAYKLADLVDQQQLQRLQLRQAQQEEKDMQATRGVLAKSDISTPEGMMKAASALAKGGQSRQAMDLMKMSGERQQQALQLDEEKIQLLTFASNEVGPKALQIKQALTTQGLPMAQAMYQQEIAGLPQSVRGHFPPQLPNDPQQASAMLDQAIQGSAQARQILMQQDEMRHRHVGEERAQKSLDIQEERLNLAEKAAAQKSSEQGAFGGKVGDLMAALAERGVSLPAGFRSKAQQRAMFESLLSRHPDKSPDQIADDVKAGKLKLAAETKATQIAGGQVGKVALASNELDTFGDQVVEASAKVPRGLFGQGKSRTLNGLIQAKDSEFSDPNLLRLKAKLTALNNAYDQLAARGGTDMEKRAHIHSLFDARLSDQAIKTLVKAMKEEAAGARTAAKRTISETSDSAAIPGTGGAESARTPSGNKPSWAE